MKKTILIALLVIIGLISMAFINAAHAEEVTLQWDENIPAPDGYRLFQKVEGGEFDFSSPVWSGTDTMVTLEIEDNLAYTWVVRAFVADVESSNSNTVSFTYEPVPDPVIIPNRPKRLILEFE